MKYFIPIFKELEDEHYHIRSEFYKSIFELLNSFEKLSLDTSFYIAEVKSNKLKSGPSNGNYTIVKIFTLNDLIEEYYKTQNCHYQLIKQIFKCQDLTESDVLAILDKLYSESSKRNIYDELEVILRWEHATEAIFNKVINQTDSSINRITLTGIYLLIIHNSQVTSKILDKVFIRSMSYSILKAVAEPLANNPKTDSETLDELVCELIKNSLTDGFLVIVKNPNTQLKTLYRIFNNYKDSKLVKKAIIDNPNVSEELLKSILKEEYQNAKILFKIIINPKMTFEMLEDIVLNSIASMQPSRERRNLIAAIIYCPILTGDLLEKLIKIVDLSEIEIIGRSKILNHEIVSKLYKKFNETADLKLFEKLLYLEKVLIIRMCEDNTCDNKLDVRKEYLKVLNRYLRSSFLEVRIKVLEEMIKEEYLKEEDIIDLSYIKECKRDLKICPLILTITKIGGNYER